MLVLLPTSNTLVAQWQGPYKVIKQVGTVNYLINMHDRRKRERLFHINMLREYLPSTPADSSSLWSEGGTSDGDEDNEIPVWKEENAGAVHYGPQLTEQQKNDLDGVVSKFSEVLASTPGRTSCAEHSIITGSARPVRLPAYRIPYAYRDKVRKEIEEMLEEGIIEHSNSEWSSPIVLVGKKDGSLRLYVDYWRLNTLSQADAYPMPRIDEMLDQLGTARISLGGTGKYL